MIEPSINYSKLTNAELDWVQDGSGGNIKLTEVSTPTGTASGIGLLYVKSSDSKLYYQNDSGTETDLTATGASTNPGGTNKQIQFNDSSSFAGATAFVYDKATQFVGIGITTPRVALDVSGSAIVTGSAVIAHIIGGTATTSDLVFQTTTGQGAISGADMHFLVGNNGSAEAMTILYDGKVGIGTTAPAYKLQVVDTISLGDGAGSNMGDNNMIRPTLSSAFLNLKGGAGRGKISIGNDNTVMVSGNSSGYIGFNVNSSSATNAGTEKMRIDINGQLGIGTTAPAYLLDVNGTAEVRNFLIRGNNGTATISTLNLTADRTISLPNSSGTLYITGGTDVAVADGGTGASTAGDARTNLGIVSASLTAEGLIEIATTAETTTGTDATRAISPDGLAGSDYGKRVVGILVAGTATTMSLGDAKATFRVPSVMNGWNLVAVAANNYVAGTTSAAQIQIRNKTDSNDMLSTKLFIDSAETDSSTAATAYVINTAVDDLATGDVIAVDVDAIHGSAASGLYVELICQLP